MAKTAALNPARKRRRARAIRATRNARLESRLRSKASPLQVQVADVYGVKLRELGLTDRPKR